MARKRPLLERFEEKILITPSCWIWTAQKKTKGYGVIGVAGKTKTASRVSYELYVGEIPNGLFVLHRCDNPSFVNPDHLFLGTAADNAADRDAKGRTVVPAPSHRRKLSDAQAIFAKECGLPNSEAAKHLGVSRFLVARIRRGVTYQDVFAKSQTV